jgi:anaerobic magnesium-protoporphyrin IX monomethyl ester cyclase
MKVALVKPPTPTLRDGKISKPPLELLTLAAALQSNDFAALLSAAYKSPVAPVSDVSIHDWSSMENLRRLNSLVERLRGADVVGITATTPQITQAHRIAGLLRTSGFRGTIVVGGPHVTLAPEASFADRAIDVINIGEGVESFPLTVNDVATGEAWRASGLIYRDANDKRGQSAASPPRLDLGEHPLPSAAASLLSLDDYDCSGFFAHGGTLRTPVALVQSNVGCGLPCAFCSVNVLSPVRREKPIARAEADIYGYMRLGFRLFHIVDDIFSYPVDRPLELARSLEANVNPGEIEWVFNLRADRRFTRNLASDDALFDYFTALARGHCIGVNIGVESGDETVLREMDKTTDLTEVERITKIARRARLGVKWYLMVGLPGQNWASIEKTIALLKRAQPTGIAASILVPHPGTRMARDPRVRLLTDRYEEMIACPEPKNRYTDRIEAVIETDAMSRQEITDARVYLVEQFTALSAG